MLVAFIELQRYSVYIDVSTQCTLLATSVVGWLPLGDNTRCRYPLVTSEGQCTPLAVSGIYQITADKNGHHGEKIQKMVKIFSEYLLAVPGSECAYDVAGLHNCRLATSFSACSPRRVRYVHRPAQFQYLRELLIS